MTDTPTLDPVERRLAATLAAKADQLDLAAVPPFPESGPLLVTHEPSPVESSVAGRRSGRSGRTRRIVLVAACALVLVVVAGLVVAHRGTSSSTTATAPPTTGAAPSSTEASTASGDALLARLEAISPSVAEQVGAGRTVTPLASVAGQAPDVLYIGAEFCSYCAAERWPLVLALSRFGTFQDLGLTRSSTDPTEPDPGTVSFSFHGASFTSPYLHFTGVETKNRDEQPLDQPTPAELQLEQQVNAAGAIPFLAVGDKALLTGADLDVEAITGHTYDQIVEALADPATAISQGVWGAANQLTASFCQVTGGQPTDVCTSPAIAALRPR